jgi:hypothetical protein
MKLEFRAHFVVRGGKVEWKNPSYVTHQLANFEGCEGIAIAKRKWNKRSTNQNALYWLWLSVMSKDIGHTEEELHVIMKGLHAPKKEVKVGNKTYMIPKSTQELSKGEFVEYMFHVETEANQLGIELPHPNELDNE